MGRGSSVGPRTWEGARGLCIEEGQESPTEYLLSSNPNSDPHLILSTGQGEIAKPLRCKTGLSLSVWLPPSPLSPTPPMPLSTSVIRAVWGCTVTLSVGLFFLCLSGLLVRGGRGGWQVGRRVWQGKLRPSLGSRVTVLCDSLRESQTRTKKSSYSQDDHANTTSGRVTGSHWPAWKSSNVIPNIPSDNSPHPCLALPRTPGHPRTHNLSDTQPTPQPPSSPKLV